MPLTIWVIPFTHGWLQTAARGWKRTGRTSYKASSHQIGVWSETRIFARGFLVVSGVLRRQQQMVDPAAHL